VTEVRSHGVSVVGAVKRPGTLQIYGATSLLEVLSLAGGLAEGAGDTILIVRQGNAPGASLAPPAIREPQTLPPAASDPVVAAAAASTVSESGAVLRVKVKSLIDAHDPSANLPVFPGDVINVQDADVVYVVGAVNKAGAFVTRGNDRLTVLRALALGEGLEPTAARSNAIVLRTNARGERVEIPVDLDRVLNGQTPDIPLLAQDVLFVPTSGGKVAARATLDFIARVITFRGFVP
jgi:polysaccharide export outer membrane protein